MKSAPRLGRKSWVTNGPAADLLLIWARTGERTDAIRGFLVERDARGLSVERIERTLGMRAAPLGRVALDRVRVPADALLPHAWGLTDINDDEDADEVSVKNGTFTISFGYRFK